jgi:hypothetical protein
LDTVGSLNELAAAADDLLEGAGRGAGLNFERVGMVLVLFHAPDYSVT